MVEEHLTDFLLRPCFLLAPQHARLSEVLDLLELHGIGAVPVADENGKVVDIYSRSDITFLATASDPDSVLKNLDCKLSDILAQPDGDAQPQRDSLITCMPDDTLQTIFERFAETHFKRIVCVDSDGRCRGLISVSDLLGYFVNPPAGESM
jgi:5'-AMP-activated protein kinase regulatory gamma subunit